MDSSGLPSLLMQAAQSAAEADGVKVPSAEAEGSADGAAAAADGVKSEGNEKDSGARNQIISAPAPVPKPKAKAKKASPPAQAPSPSASSEPNKKRTTSRPLRRGKWTPEEEAYANRLIQEFKAGLLPLTDGTTLRTFLSKLLNCDPMRISKKFVGSNCIGKQVFRRRGADVNNMTPAEIEKTRYELSELEKKFLDRVAQNKSSGKGSGGGGSSRSSKKQSSKLSGGGNMSASAGGGLGGLNNNMNKSAAAVGRALLQGNKAPQQQGNGDGGGSSAGGLLAQLQAQQPGMFDNNTARSFLNAAGSQGSGSGLGNMNTNASITNLMLQTGMSRDQISQLASKGISSSASLANMLGKQRSFDQLMSLDFQSMQSIDNLANLIQAGMPGQASRLPKAAMKNMDWGTQGSQTNALGSSGASGLLARSGGSMQGSIENLVRTLSSSSAGGLHSNQASVNNNLANANFGNFLQNATQQNNNLGGGGGGSNGLNNILQTLQQQQHQQQQQQQQNQNNNNLNYGNLLQNMAQGNNAGSLFQTNSNNSFGSNLSQNNPGGANDLMNMLSQSQNAGNTGHQNNVNPLLQQLNNPFGGLQNAGSGNDTNPLMAAMAQQQLLAQASGGNNNMANLLGQQNGLAGLGMNFNNNALGNMGALGGNFGGNLGNLGNLGGLGGVNLGGGNNNQNTAALFQQLLQQNQSSGANNSNQGNAQVAQGGGGDNTSGNKRSIDEVNGGANDGPNTKTVAL